MDYSLTLMQITALIISGVAYALLGSVKVPLSKQLNIDESGMGGLMSMFGLTLIPMALIAGILCDSIGRQFIISSGFALIAISLVLLAHSKNFKMGLVAVLVFGTGWAAAVNALNVLSPPAFLEPKDIPAENHYAMNLGDFIFGMGAFVAPILFAIMIKFFKVTKTFYLFAAISLLPLLLGLSVNWNAEILKFNPSGSLTEGFKILLQDPLVWLCSLAMFFHFPLEFSVATWSTTLMTDKKISEPAATGLLSAFWLTFLFSRLATAFFLPAEYKTILLISMAALALVCTIGLILSKSGSLTSVLIILLGAVMGPIFPTLIGILVGGTEGALQGRAVGIFFSLGGIGCTLIPMLVGSYAKKTTLQRGFVFVAGCAMALLAFTVTLHFHLADK